MSRTKVVAALVVASGVAAFVPAAATAKLLTVGLGGWQVQSSARAHQSGTVISRPRFATGTWLHVRPDDAGAAGTEVNALVQNGRWANVFFSTNMKTCFGYMSRIGPDTIKEFAVPWWFRTTFRAPLGRRTHAQLIVNGVVGEADVWINGTRIATRAAVRGDYTRFVRRHPSPAPRDKRACAARLPQRPDEDVHARQRRLDPDPA